MRIHGETPKTPLELFQLEKSQLRPLPTALYHQGQGVSEHVRSYERHGDFQHPDHARPLLEQRLKARQHQLLHRFLSLCP